MLILLCALIAPSSAAEDPASLDDARLARTTQARPRPRDVLVDDRPVIDPDEMVVGEPTELDATRTRASLQRHRDRLAEVLAVETWSHGPQARQPSIELHDPFELLLPLARRSPYFEDLVAGEDIVAARMVLEHGPYSSTTWTRTHYKVVERDNRVDAVAFAVQQATRGRAVAYTSTDVLVVFEDGRPSEIFISTVKPWGLSFSERHLDLKFSGSGKVIGAVETRLEGKKDADPTMLYLENDPRTTWDTLTATRRVWNRE